jgi:outer membrane protein assembly factor BamB
MKIIRSILPKTLLLVLFCSASVTIVYSQLFEWRGPAFSGIFDETGLMKKWPDGETALLRYTRNTGDGYSSQTVTDDAIYVTGRSDSSDLLTAMTLDGK